MLQARRKHRGQPVVTDITFCQFVPLISGSAAE
jgi:hypothetical protein